MNAACTRTYRFRMMIQIGLTLILIVQQPSLMAFPSTDQSAASTSTPSDKSATAPLPSTKNGKHTATKKKIIHEGGTVEPTAQLAPGMTPEQAARQRQNTEDLLASTEANLQKLSSRSLGPDQQATVDQVRDFMKQARAANDASDFTRARNLAFKAQLLSDDLVRH